MALSNARKEANGGFDLDMWAAVVDRNGLVVAVVFTGATATDQWPGSRVIAAQKANTANAFSLPHLALPTANLYAATQPGGTLFGLQDANPTHDELAHGGRAAVARRPHRRGRRCSVWRAVRPMRSPRPWCSPHAWNASGSHR